MQDRFVIVVATLPTTLVHFACSPHSKTETQMEPRLCSDRLLRSEHVGGFDVCCGSLDVRCPIIHHFVAEVKDAAVFDVFRRGQKKMCRQDISALKLPRQLRGMKWRMSMLCGGVIFFAVCRVAARGGRTFSHQFCTQPRVAFDSRALSTDPFSDFASRLASHAPCHETVRSASTDDRNGTVFR